jgi:ATP-dependent Lon protease
MKESAIALEYIKANAKLMGLNPEIISNYNIHLHVPEGATPKTGLVLV